MSSVHGLTAGAYDYLRVECVHARKLLVKCESDGLKAQCKASMSYLELAIVLRTARDVLATPGWQGEFSPWVDIVFGFSKATAYRMIDVAIAFEGLEWKSSSFTPAALKELSKKHIPPEIRIQAIDVAKTAKVFTGRMARDLIDDLTDSTPKVVVPEEIKQDVAPSVVKAVESGEVLSSPKAIKEISNYDIPSQTAILKAAKGDKDGGMTLDEAIEDLAPADDQEMTTKEFMSEWNSEVESWAKGVVAMVENVPESPWVDKTDLQIIKDQLKSAASTARQLKGYKACPKCENGCKVCRHTGFCTRTAYESNV